MSKFEDFKKGFSDAIDFEMIGCFFGTGIIFVLFVALIYLCNVAIDWIFS